MRIGFHPKKDKELESLGYTHQVIIPVYIPETTGYFKDSLAILKITIASLLKTCHSETFFSVINNGSSDEVSRYLDTLHTDLKIQELIKVENLGKINGVFKGISGHQFEYVTVTDCDVLFKNNWQLATYSVFKDFPKAGYVTTSPNPKLLKYYTFNTIVSNLFSKKLTFKASKSSSAFTQFAKSIGNPEFYNKVHYEKVLVLKGRNCNAILGAGHFCGTYKATTIYGLKKSYSKFQLGGDTDRLFFDKPISKIGFSRLATENTYTHHLGNTVEFWMEEELSKIKDEATVRVDVPVPKSNPYTIISTKINFWIFNTLIRRKPFWNFFLTQKGLTKSEAKDY